MISLWFQRNLRCSWEAASDHEQKHRVGGSGPSCLFLILSNEHQKQLNSQAAPKQRFPPLATASPRRLTTHSLRGLAPKLLSAQTPLTMRKENCGHRRASEAKDTQPPPPDQQTPLTPRSCLASHALPLPSQTSRALLLVLPLTPSPKKSSTEIQ